VSFVDIAPGQTVEANAFSRTATATVDMFGNVTSATVIAADTENSSVQLGYDAGLNLTRLSIATPQSNVTFSGATQIACDPAVCVAENHNASGVAVNPLGAGWNYQTHGFWIVEMSATTGLVGVISMGNPTPAMAIPSGGTASYSGGAVGIYVDGGGAIYGYGADMSATADFLAAFVGFTTSATEIISLDTLMSASAPSLDLTGTLTIQSGSSTFSGDLTNTAGMTGTANGRFYGPVYEEIGGVFGLTGTGPESLLGAFGGRRP
jgi:hypothetical protein